MDKFNLAATLSELTEQGEGELLVTVEDGAVVYQLDGSEVRRDPLPEGVSEEEFMAAVFEQLYATPEMVEARRKVN